ncbi:MAG: hypothetical protein K6G05_09290 [Lachnospiraceae bacterium]|jgi:hypothetical protein|nr:hypothetical protein [Lachnospiraceae bacterium]SEJ10471.1 hypothetical protein SAMN02910453_2114 [Lachnospiraceae bacterium A10]
MQDIIKEYGPALITVVAIISLVIIIKLMIGTDESSIVGSAFQNLLDAFLSQLSSVMPEA